MMVQPVGRSSTWQGHGHGGRRNLARIQPKNKMYIPATTWLASLRCGLWGNAQLECPYMEFVRGQLCRITGQEAAGESRAAPGDK